MSNARFKHWSNNRAEMKKLNIFLAEEGRKHEAELNAGKPLDLKLKKHRN